VGEIEKDFSLDLWREWNGSLLGPEEREGVESLS